MADPVYWVQQYDVCVESFIKIHKQMNRADKNLLILIYNIYA